MKQFLWIALGLCVLLSALISNGFTHKIQSTVQRFANYQQVEVMFPHGDHYQLWVADTDLKRQRGLMFVNNLPPKTGMIFIFPTAQPRQFWMKHCHIPLDLVFLNQGKIVSMISDAPPCRTSDCPRYWSGQPSDTVIELLGGTAKQLKLTVGQTIRWSL